MKKRRARRWLDQIDYAILNWIGWRHAMRLRGEIAPTPIVAEYVHRIDARIPDPARQQPLPQDTRSLTGWLLGDPLPGRSALDMERGTK